MIHVQNEKQEKMYCSVIHVITKINLFVIFYRFSNKHEYIEWYFSVIVAKIKVLTQFRSRQGNGIMIVPWTWKQQWYSICLWLNPNYSIWSLFGSSTVYIVISFRSGTTYQMLLVIFSHWILVRKYKKFLSFH